MATQKVAFKVQGMHCASCTQRVERALARLPGVVAVKVDLASGQAVVEYAPDEASERQMKETVRALGYRVA